MNTPTEKPHLSPSQMNTFYMCGERYRRSYIEKEKIPPGWALHRGGACHVAADENYTQKIDTLKDLPRASILDIAAEAFEGSLRTSGISMTPEEQTVGIKIMKGRIKDVTVSLAGVYADQVAPRVQPRSVEQQVRVVIPGSDFDLLGILDVVDIGDRIRDLKTAARMWPAGRAEKELQATVYWLMYSILEGKEPKGFEYDILVLGKKPRSEVIKTTRTAKDVAVLLSRMNAMIACLQAGNFLPSDQGNWWCSEKFCGYYHTCPYVNP